VDADQNASESVAVDHIVKRLVPQLTREKEFFEKVRIPNSLFAVSRSEAHTIILIRSLYHLRRLPDAGKLLSSTASSAVDAL
jgi:hypothetical protein